MAGRNDETHFSNVPTTQIQRSKFLREFSHKTTFNMGKLIPFYVDSDVLPGDTHTLETRMIVRLLNLAVPIMDNLYLDTYYFFIPSRLCWNNFKQYSGENSKGAWANTTELERPHIIIPATGYDENAVATYMGIPQGTDVAGCTYDREAINAYCLIWNEWFRDQNVVAPLEINMDDGDSQGSNTDPRLGGTVLPVYKFHDVFTSALPEPQKGEAINMPLGTTAPIYGNVSIFGDGSNPKGQPVLTATNTTSGVVEIATGGSTGSATRQYFYPETNIIGAYANLADATAATVNALRLAFATQRILEKDARGGTRYREVIKNHFKTNIADARAMIPEYLGGATRVPINITQVTQTSASDSTSPQGNPGATSVTANSDNKITYSAQEWGTIIGVLCIRQDHTYQQGINRMWTKRRRLDQYWPSLANIGEVPVYASELKATANNTNNDVVFGYQEAWYWYRYLPGYISGEMSSLYAQSLDAWHLGDEYNDTPVLSDEFLQETDQYLNRSLLATEHHQFLADILVENTAVRPMPIYSVPGLLDHF